MHGIVGARGKRQLTPCASSSGAVQEHGELATQHRDLNILGIRRPTATDHTEDPPQNKERQSPHHHGSRSCQAPITAAHRRALTLHPTRLHLPNRHRTSVLTPALLRRLIAWSGRVDR
jgi:hypothetical protein